MSQTLTRDLPLKKIREILVERRKELERELAYKEELNELLCSPPSEENDEKIRLLVLMNNGSENQ